MLKPKTKYIIGIDEVGRGPLAGPVVVAAVALSQELRIKNAELRIKKKPKNSKSLILNSKLAKLRDSKKLTTKQREDWFKFIKKSALCYSIASVSPKIIDKINISKAANLAATSSLRKLVNYLTIVKWLTKKKIEVFLDGGLYLKGLRIKNKELRIKNKEQKTKNKELRSNNKIKNRNPQSSILNSQTIIKGDEKIPAIALASIAAKVTRDRMMKKMHKKYPQYGFDKHKGYGTKKHFKAIKKFNLSPIHRKSFRIK